VLNEEVQHADGDPFDLRDLVEHLVGHNVKAAGFCRKSNVRLNPKQEERPLIVQLLRVGIATTRGAMRPWTYEDPF
jgi:hypothetical protein